MRASSRSWRPWRARSPLRFSGQRRPVRTIPALSRAVSAQPARARGRERRPSLRRPVAACLRPVRRRRSRPRSSARRAPSAPTSSNCILGSGGGLDRARRVAPGRQAATSGGAYEISQAGPRPALSPGDPAAAPRRGPPLLPHGPGGVALRARRRRRDGIRQRVERGHMGCQAITLGGGLEVELGRPRWSMCRSPTGPCTSRAWADTSGIPHDAGVAHFFSLEVVDRGERSALRVVGGTPQAPPHESASQHSLDSRPRAGVPSPRRDLHDVRRGQPGPADVLPGMRSAARARVAPPTPPVGLSPPPAAVDVAARSRPPRSRRRARRPRAQHRAQRRPCARRQLRPAGRVAARRRASGACPAQRRLQTAPQPSTCPLCGSANQLGMRFCVTCGAAARRAAPPPAAPARQARPVRTMPDPPTFDVEAFAAAAVASAAAAPPPPAAPAIAPARVVDLGAPALRSRSQRLCPRCRGASRCRPPSSAASAARHSPRRRPFPLQPAPEPHRRSARSGLPRRHAASPRRSRAQARRAGPRAPRRASACPPSAPRLSRAPRPASGSARPLPASTRARLVLIAPRRQRGPELPPRRDRPTSAARRATSSSPRTATSLRVTPASRSSGGTFYLA